MCVSHQLSALEQFCRDLMAPAGMFSRRRQQEALLSSDGAGSEGGLLLSWEPLSDVCLLPDRGG